MSDQYFNYIAKEKCHNLNNPTSGVNIYNYSQSMDAKKCRYKGYFFHLCSVKNKVRTLSINVFIYITLLVEIEKKLSLFTAP